MFQYGKLRIVWPQGWDIDKMNIEINPIEFT